MNASTVGIIFDNQHGHEGGLLLPARMDMRLNRKEFLALVGRGTAASMAAASVDAAMPADGTNRRSREGEERSARKRHQRDDRRRPAIHRNIEPAGDAARTSSPQGKRCLIDNVGVLLAGSTAEGSHILRRYAQKVERREGSDGASVASRSSCRRRTRRWRNAGARHALDYDDTQLSTTPDRTFGLLTHPTHAGAVGGAGGRRDGATRRARRFSRRT